jgi:hypothetical protein
MPTTTKGFPYPANSDNVDVPGDMQALAEAIDTELSDYALTTALPAIPRGNKIINGAFDIWQRGESFSNFADGVLTADRWVNFRDGSGATTSISKQTHSPGSAPSGANNPYFLRYAVTAAGTGNTYRILDNRVEDVRTFAGQTVTLSLWLKADASRTVGVALIQSFGSGGSGDVGSATTDFSVTTSWQRFTVTYTLPSISGKTVGTGSFLYLRLVLPAGVTMTVDIDEVQLESGSVATPFSRAGGTLAGERAACERYNERHDAYEAYSPFSNGAAYSTTKAKVFVPFKTTKRTGPTSLGYSTLALWDGASVVSVTAAIIEWRSVYGAQLDVTVASGLTANRPYLLIANGSTNAYLEFPAEL